MESQESKELTNLLEKAQDMFWRDKDMNKCTVGFAYNYPRDIDWVASSSYSCNIFDKILKAIDNMEQKGEPLTEYQREMLELD